MHKKRRIKSRKLMTHTLSASCRKQQTQSSIESRETDQKSIVLYEQSTPWNDIGPYSHTLLCANRNDKERRSKIFLDTIMDRRWHDEPANRRGDNPPPRSSHWNGGRCHRNNHHRDPSQQWKDDQRGERRPRGWGRTEEEESQQQQQQQRRGYTEVSSSSSRHPSRNRDHPDSYDSYQQQKEPQTKRRGDWTMQTVSKGGSVQLVC